MSVSRGEFQRSQSHEKTIPQEWMRNTKKPCMLYPSEFKEAQTANWSNVQTDREVHEHSASIQESLKKIQAIFDAKLRFEEVEESEELFILGKHFNRLFNDLGSPYHMKIEKKQNSQFLLLEDFEDAMSWSCLTKINELLKQFLMNPANLCEKNLKKILTQDDYMPYLARLRNATGDNFKIWKIQLDLLMHMHELFQNQRGRLIGVIKDEIKEILEKNKAIDHAGKLEVIENKIQIRYVEKQVEHEIVNKIGQILDAAKKIAPKRVVLYGDLLNNLEHSFHNLNFEMASEWQRCFANEAIVFLDENDRIILKPSKESVDQGANFLDKYFSLLSEKLYKNGLILSFFFQKFCENMQIAYSSKEKTFALYEKIFKKILSMDENEKGLTFQAIDKELRMRFLTTKVFSEQIAEDVLQLQRIYSQVYLMSPLMSIIDNFREVFTVDQHVIGQQKNEKSSFHQPAKSIYVKFFPGFYQCRFLKKGFLQNHDCTIVQEVTTHVPIRPTPQFDQPFSVQLYYQLPVEERDGDVSLRLKQLALLLRAKGFPPMKEYKMA